MKRLLSPIAALCALALLVAGGMVARGEAGQSGPPSALAMTIAAVADTYVVEGGGNNGGSATLYLAYHWYLNDVESSYALLRFDVAAALPANAVIDSAVMRVYLSAIGNTTSYLPVDVAAYLVRSSWGEYSVTWSTQPSLWPFIVATKVDYPLGWKSWNVTTWAQNWLADPGEN